jgi:hypothetical protein
VKRLAILPLVAVALGCGLAASASDQKPIRVVGFSRIGTFKVHGGNPAKARAAFGTPTRTRATRNRDGLIVWRGLEISFYTLAHAKQCLPDTPFGGATITGPWVTDHGLRRGDTVAKAKKLYPVGSKLRPHFVGAHALGLVVRLSQAVGDYGLAAKVVNGRVTALLISDPQGGE